MPTNVQSQKLLVVLATSLLVTAASIENISQLLEKVPYIHYPFHFWKDLHKTKALIDINIKVKAISLAYVAKLGLNIQKTDTRTQKIDSSILDIFGMVLADFQVKDKLNKIWFFQETFLVVNIMLEVIIGIAFLTLRNVDI